MSYTLGISTKDNKEQAELARLIHENNKPIIYCTGNAGTGKTFISLAAALQLLENKKYKKIYYIREPIEVGKSLGFLPGGLDSKYGVFLEGLYDNLERISDMTHRNLNDLKMKIEPIAPEFIRGRSLENCIIIADESQNFSRTTIKTILTRIGKYCKVVLIGSTNQIDARGMTRDNNDFMKTYEALKEQPFIGYINLVKSERSDICSIIDDLL